MSRAASVAVDLGVAARLGWRALRRRLGGTHAAAPDLVGFRSQCEALLARAPAGLIAQHQIIELPATRPPWSPSGWPLEAGDSITSLACGRTLLSRPLDIWVEPSFQLWLRIGEQGPVFRGTRNTHSFVASHAGALQLASYFPGEWASPDGRLATSERDYAKVSGSICVLLIRWCRGIDAADGVAALAAIGDVQGLLAGERERLARAAGESEPAGWRHLWFLGPSEIYRRAPRDHHADAICCSTHRDVAILQHDAELALMPDTRLHWSWKVDALPSSLREDSIPTHDYLSIAVEFDNGLDLTYLWSAALPVGTHFRCPLPTWKDRETHWVVRSGSAELGRWLDESRNVYDDYRIAIGGTVPTRIVRVWLIAVSLFQRGEGRCAYAGIRLSQGNTELKID